MWPDLYALARIDAWTDRNEPLAALVVMASVALAVAATWAAVCLCRKVYLSCREEPTRWRLTADVDLDDVL